MEMLTGTTLRALVGEEVPLLPLDRTLRIAVDIANVLVAAHEIGIVHRDLKPENVFIERAREGGDRVVVVDFGLAFMGDREGLGRMTQDGMITGTPDYISPEQAQGRAVGVATDVYAFGCMLYEMLTSVVPFRGHYMHVLTQQLFAAPTPPSDVRRDLVIPHAVEELVMEMLRKEPAARPTASEVQGVLASMTKSPQRERARAQIGTEGRAARMLSTYRPPPNQVGNEHATLAPGATASMAETKHLAIVGALAGDLIIGLGANGLVPFIVSPEQPVTGADAIFAPGASAERITELKQHRVPIVSDAAPTDMDRIAQMLKLGVDEVVVTPIAVEELARKTWRAIRKAARAKRVE